jgi:hypothetical protein
MLRKKQEHFEDAITLCEKASEEGWAGDWHDEILK